MYDPTEVRYLGGNKYNYLAKHVNLIGNTPEEQLSNWLYKFVDYYEYDIAKCITITSEQIQKHIKDIDTWYAIANDAYHCVRHMATKRMLNNFKDNLAFYQYVLEQLMYYKNLQQYSPIFTTTASSNADHS